MKNSVVRTLLGFFLVTQIIACASTLTVPAAHSPKVSRQVLLAQDPAQLYGELFVQVQTAPLYEDSKYFVDMVPRRSPPEILADYRRNSPQAPEQLRRFVNENFSPPAIIDTNFKAAPGETIDSRIKNLWTHLKREPDEETVPGASLIPLPHPYVVPGGRFREIYYWDSYFTLLGLQADGEHKAVRDMVRNFAHLAVSLKRIPNGNRDYYRGRSQPPFFSHMVAIWQKNEGDLSASQFLPALKQEYDFWMKGTGDLKVGEANARVFRFREGVLNRYDDDGAGPRPEAYKEDVALADRASQFFKREPSTVYRDLRAGAESGWDYSTRWFKDPTDFATLQTTAFLPIDLNCLLYHLEMKISELSMKVGEESEARNFRQLAESRKRLIQKYLWDESDGVFRDYDWTAGRLSKETTVAMVVPLFTGVATKDQARRTAKALEAKFLKPGGLVTSLRTSGQQWDAPNGWAPHQWMGYAGLRRYGFHDLAEKVRKRWLGLNLKVFQATGRLMEKYNVVDMSLESGGGEYPLQDGFGWTNGVYRALSTPIESMRHLR